MEKDTIGELLSQGKQRSSNQRRFSIQWTLISIRQLGTEDLVTTGQMNKEIGLFERHQPEGGRSDDGETIS